MKFAASLALAAAGCASAGKVTFGKPPPINVPTPAENFTWSDPFAQPAIRNFDVTCSTELTFKAGEFLLHDLQAKSPKGLWNYGDALKKVFKDRPYPGGWDGIDRHLHDREVIIMEYSEMPLAVREWIEEQDRTGAAGKGLFAVYEKPGLEEKAEDVVAPPAEGQTIEERAESDKNKVALFCPGALYSILPLWVAEKSGCKYALFNLGSYSAEPKDGGVVAWTTGHTLPDRGAGERDMTFTIKAQSLKAKPVAAAAKESLKEAVEEIRDEL